MIQLLRNRLWGSLVGLLLSLVLVGGRPTPVLAQPVSKAAEKVDFGRQILPLLSARCFRCHGPDEEQRQGDLRLDRAVAADSVLAAGRPDQSAVVARIRSTDPKKRMPPPDSNLALNPDEVALLTRWISEGAEYALHWAYQRPGRPVVPKTEKDPWSRNEIDAFVLARLQDAQLEPAAAADQVTLIRRLSLDLTGLPASIREVDRFVNDRRPRAYEKLIDRLLASEHYGERMAQGWLDLARYGDTNGYENDSDRSMWLYRDWVINAFNTNMPFDRFTIEQIAGDLLPNASQSQQIASGFNRNTTYNEEGGADAEEFLVAYAVERASTTGTVFLGMTLGCAQCHEHKYDPISQSEFYAFYAFFNSVDGERGATGHDIPLPPLLSLPTNRQVAQQDDVRQALAELAKRIAKEVAAIELELAGGAQIAAEQPASETPPDPDGGEETKQAAQPTHFNQQSAWEQFERSREKSTLSKELLELVKKPPAERDDKQKKQLRDYFVEHAYVGGKARFAPLHKRQTELRETEQKLDKAIPSTMVMAEMKERRDAFLLIRGDFEQPGQKVTPDVPAIFPRMPSDQPRTRLGLAYWLVDPRHPLVARVAVNRLWKQLFGRGLVTTMGDFGVRGELPSHPQLLDWLATEFVRTGWDVKALQKKIMMSATYRQASRYRAETARVDPYNGLLARQSRFRLSAEGIRDVALSIGGLLNDDIGGPSVYPFQPEGYYADKGRWKWPQSEGRALYRRGLYTFWRRTTMYPAFQIFDAPSRETCVVNRARTNTPLQALVTLNDPTFVQAARTFAKRILERGGDARDTRLAFAFRSAVCRAPDPNELETLERLYETQRKRFESDLPAAKALTRDESVSADKGFDVAELATWTAVANVLLNLDETITRD